MDIKNENFKMVGKLGVIVLAMFAFGYGLVPVYKAICEMTGINVLALGDRKIPGATPQLPANTQVDLSRTITVEFDANARGPWHFKPAESSLKVHPGELTTVMYEFQAMRLRRRRRISASWNAFVSASTHSLLARKSSGRWLL